LEKKKGAVGWFVTNIQLKGPKDERTLRPKAVNLPVGTVLAGQLHGQGRVGKKSGTK